MISIILIVTIAILFFTSLLMIVIGVKTIKNRRVDDLIKILFRFNGSTIGSYKALYPKKIADEKTSEFYSKLFELRGSKVIAIGIANLVLGGIMMWVSVFAFLKLFIRH